ncbi:uncharacterized protein HMPREF1541_02919 [Cyphellophora europaea CBS 101466]|uniref:Uncharacterized protein n=1 Tax=Cyphellophora europaea (strain CBS 101466) TaxID=1220924 RepID=W2RX32_CYPE1|nr:uncharacterized protein HMPREF1541_02919 [Cyphellophora europaea CBS 101466]ETN40987.1 hypothetical protein HMPREF1541_02919 [Cyphellophora europaea CBS 101466]
MEYLKAAGIFIGNTPATGGAGPQGLPEAIASLLNPQIIASNTPEAVVPVPNEQVSPKGYMLYPQAIVPTGTISSVELLCRFRVVSSNYLNRPFQLASNLCSSKSALLTNNNMNDIWTFFNKHFFSGKALAHI